MRRFYSRKELDASFLCIKNKKNPAPKRRKGGEAYALGFYAVT